VAFAVGEHVKGGVYGVYPSLERSEQADGGNLKHNMDFRSVYATILEDWMGMNPAPIIGGHYNKVQFLYGRLRILFPLPSGERVKVRVSPAVMVGPSPLPSPRGRGRMHSITTKDML
jgi:hypothetical protein